MRNSCPIHGNSCLYKTYNYHELNANYHKLILFSYLPFYFFKTVYKPKQEFWPTCPRHHADGASR